MGEWRTTTLGEASERVDYGLTTSAVWGAKGPRFLRITDIDGPSINWTSVPRCAASPTETEKYRLQDGDLVIARTGASTGRSQWVQTVEATVFASYLVRFRIRKDYDSRFVAYVLQTSSWTDYVGGLAHGKSAQPNMSARDMGAFTLAVPPLGVQRAIAEVLGALDDKIAANTRLAATADSLADAILRKDLSARSSPLAEIAQITMGSSPPGTSYNEEYEGTPFFQGIRDFGFRTPKLRVWTTAPVRLAQAGDTLLSVRAPVGQANLAPVDLCIGRGLASVRSRDGRPFTLFHLLRDSPEVWAPYEAEGTVFGSINGDQLARLEVRDVLAGAERSVEDQLASVEARIASALDENRDLASTRDALLPALMSGRLRVRDAERIATDLT